MAVSGDEEDLMSMLESHTQEIAETIDDRFVSWFCGGTQSKLDLNGPYIKSVLAFFDYLSEDDNTSIVEKRTLAPDKIINRKQLAAKLVKYLLLSHYSDGIHVNFAKQPINIDLCIERILQTTLGKTIIQSYSSKRALPK